MTTHHEETAPDWRFPLAVARLHHVGRRRLRLLLQHAAGHHVTSKDAFAAFIEASAGELKMTVSAADVERAWTEAVRLNTACERRGWHLWVMGTPTYPPELARLHDPPALLFVHGPADLAVRPRVAIVGTREPSPWGDATARACAEAAVDAGATVVSGLAWGIDTAAHTAAVGRQGRTWAMLPSSLDIIYPSSNTALADRIVHHGGALVSEYPPGTHPHATFFVERDRLQAALSDAVIVIETGLKGGTMHTVRFARELGVPVHVTFPDGAEPGPGGRADQLPDAQQGTWTLLQQGARRLAAAGVGDLVRSLRR